MEKLCTKCGYQRKPGDGAPETECQHCSALAEIEEAELRGLRLRYTYN